MGERQNYKDLHRKIIIIYSLDFSLTRASNSGGNSFSVFE